MAVTLQLAASGAAFVIGLWALARPKHVQSILHDRTMLVPEVSSRSMLAPAMFRAIGFLIILQAATTFGF